MNLISVGDEKLLRNFGIELVQNEINEWMMIELELLRLLLGFLFFKVIFKS